MFKQVKSALFWYYLYKFRKKVLLIIFLLLVAIFANMIYADVVEYLTLKDKLQYLEIALISKWSIILFNLLFSVYLILTLFKIEKEESQTKEVKKEKKLNKELNEEPKKQEVESKFTKREEEFLTKDLKSRADTLLDR